MALDFSLSQEEANLAERFKHIIAPAIAQKRDALTETEGMAMLEAMGVAIPRKLFLKSSTEFSSIFDSDDSDNIAQRESLRDWGEKLVVKVISPEILHKTEMGGVAILPNNRESIVETLKDMERRFSSFKVDGYTINEFVQFEPKLGHEILFGYRFAPDFGPLVSFGPGGIFTEFLASKLKQEESSITISPFVATRDFVKSLLSRNLVAGLLSAGLRNTKATIDIETLVDAIMTFLSAAKALASCGISEFEVNPMVVRKNTGDDSLHTKAPLKDVSVTVKAGNTASMVALDCLVKLKNFSSVGITYRDRMVPHNAAQAKRPVVNIDKILKPRSAAIIGVSEKWINNGRIILRNLLENGFDASAIYVIKPGAEQIDGCRCVPDVASLPEKVDLFILVISASRTPETLAQIAELDKAWSVILIPGGLEEKSGSHAIVDRMKKALLDARAQGRGPLINGGNCLGIRSVPGKYNTLFIPEEKLPMPKGRLAPLALISQSGAFGITRISKHPDINPKYLLTLGNQMDLTIGDYLEYLEKDKEIRVFAVYVEGFKALDGLKTFNAAREIVNSGRSLILYRAGRTSAGAGAAASHTASIAGDYAVTKALFENIGAIVCDSLDEFDDAVRTFTLLEGRKAKGNRLGALSNAGFECVAFADNLSGMELARFSESTNVILAKVLEDAGISDIVDLHNPLDITPMGSDDAYDRSFRAIVADENTDLGIVGIVPFTSRMNSLAAEPARHKEDVRLPDSIANRYGSLLSETQKPFVAVVDTGALYDPLVRILERHGIVVFRTADRALRMLERWRKSAAGH
jgi:acyl-CoA synthetase (NDP forming)